MDVTSSRSSQEGELQIRCMHPRLLSQSQFIGKVDLRDADNKDFRWMEVAQDRDQCRALEIEVIVECQLYQLNSVWQCFSVETI